MTVFKQGFEQPAFARFLVAGSLAACLLVGTLSLVGCASSAGDSAASDPSAQAAQKAPSYTVKLEDIDGATLLGDFKDDPSNSAEASLVELIQLDINRDTRQVDMTISAATSDVAQMCAIGEAAARSLSDQASVTDDEGAPPADDGPCGALYEAYTLSIRVQGFGSGDVVDGLLHPGDSAMTWQ